MEELRQEILRNRSEIINSVEASETRILLKFEELKNKVNLLERENEELKAKVEFLERSSKKNNILIFGLDQPATSNSANVCKELNKLLGIDIGESHINNIYPIKNIRNNPVKVELISYLKKQEILKNCRKLKGTRISIAQDLTFEQRNRNKILREHLNRAKQNKENKAYIKRETLYINDKSYTVEELVNFDSAQHKEKFNSASPTPNIRNKEALETDSVFEFSNDTIGQYTSTQQTNVSKEVSVPPLTGTVKKKISTHQLVKLD